jgi:hypothetical protein
MKHFWGDRAWRNWIEDLRDIAARLDNVDVRLCDGDRVRDARTLNQIADSLEHQVDNR